MKDIQQSSLLDKASHSIDKNKTATVGLLVLILAVFGAYTAYSSYQQKYEDKAQAAFFEAERLYAVSQGSKAHPEKDAAPTNVDTTQVEEKLNSVINEFPKSAAAVQASVLMADIELEKKDSTKAIATLEKSFESFNGHLIDSLMALKLSSLYEQNKQCDKAIPVLEKIYNSEVKELRPEALLRQALCEETLGQAEKAKQSYQKLATEYSDTNQGQQAQKYLKIM